MSKMQAQQVSNSNVFVEIIGEGEPVVVLHGWGMHGGVFRNALNSLGKQIHLVDLPGHGHSKSFQDFSDINLHAEFLADELTEILREGVTLIGWSMGGLLAQLMATRFPEQIKKLVLITGTPAFINQADWQLGIDGRLLENFGSDLVNDFKKTLERFLAIQFLGTDDQKAVLRQTKNMVFSKPTPDVTMLQQGLELLKNTDLRQHLPEIQCPTLIINGERDSLITTAAARYLSETVPNGKAIIIKGSGHAPFLSHPESFHKYLTWFLNE